MYRVAERIQTSDDSADPDESSTTGPSVIISVRMVADEERKATASEKAVKHYETPRVVHMVLVRCAGVLLTDAQNDPLQKLAGAIAERLGKEVHDLVFVYKRRRIYALSQTPEELGMYGSAELGGSECLGLS
jgi:hypothetical protein